MLSLVNPAMLEVHEITAQLFRLHFNVNLDINF